VGCEGGSWTRCYGRSMTTVFSETFPNTHFRMRMKAVQTLGGMVLDVALAEAASEDWFAPRRYRNFEEPAAILADIGLDLDEITKAHLRLTDTGEVEIDDLWLTAEQAARLWVHIQRSA
jgi:hypothetical protein